MTRPECSTCHFVFDVPTTPLSDLSQGIPRECHRYPPTPIVLNPQQVFSLFPSTKGTNWCGEYRKRSDA